MRRVIMVCLALALAAPLFVAPSRAIPTDSTAPASPAALRAKLADAEATAAKRPFDGHLLAAKARAVIDDPAFAQLDADGRHEAYVLLGGALLFTDDPAGAKAALDISSAMPQADNRDWDFRMFAAEGVHDTKAAAESLLMLVQNYPDVAVHEPDEIIFQVAGNADRFLPRDSAVKLLEGLHAQGWHPSSPFSNAGALWFTLVRFRLEDGDVSGASTLMGEVNDTDAYVIVRSDKRFDAIAARDPDRFDVSAARDLGIVLAQARSAAAPGKLEGVIDVAVLLLDAGRNADALSLIDAAIARDKADPKTFSDAGDQRNWALDTRARALVRLGRFDEALTIRVAAARLQENGDINVSQTINLGDLYVELGRPRDALDAVAKLGPMSGFGQMQFEGVRACAYALLGDTASLAKSLDYMKSHAKDAPETLTETEVCAGDLDSAAHDVIAQLADPATRGAMLLQLQDYLSVKHGPTGDMLYARWLSLRERPDVRAAIDKVGRIGKWPLAPPP